jgi:uncharacterized coiled-coil protein SlyX
MEAGTIIALAAMLISLFLGSLKYLDRRSAKKKEQLQIYTKSSNADVERESIIVRGAEGALLLMEKTLKTANDECEKRIRELEEENNEQRCQIKELKEVVATQGQQINSLTTEMKELTRRVDNG